MGYVSTRGEAPAAGFFDILLAGLAGDGGLYVPRTWPRLSPEEIADFAGRPYAEVASRIIGAFIGEEMAPSDLAAICADSYATFSHPAVAPLEQIAPGRFLLNLFHGPTLAFKDIAMQVLARLYDHALARRGLTMTIVCATSGDTGGAAVEAFRGRARVRIAALFPHGRISETQRRFMTTPSDSNVRAIAVDGDFDDCQAMVKSLFADHAFAREVSLSAVNSINFARIAAQSVYYFTSATALGAPHRPVAFAIPTGNFGDAYSAYAAARMGLAIERVIVATNANDIVARALEVGRYVRGQAVATQSPAMDIQVASNFERLYFECAGRDGAATAAAFRAFAARGALEVSSNFQTAARALFRGSAVSEMATSAAIRDMFETTGILVDPHTAVALAAADRLETGRGATPLVVLSTAHPAKFPDAVLAAAGVAPISPAAVVNRRDRPERLSRLPADVEAVKRFIRAFAAEGV